jgi:hypothetical protein
MDKGMLRWGCGRCLIEDLRLERGFVVRCILERLGMLKGWQG